ncbi:MAG TPA: SET domain-containing protein-lysine N-methyltransferase [Gemmatirosa sp.]
MSAAADAKTRDPDALGRGADDPDAVPPGAPFALGPSPMHGTGAFAICAIPAGTRLVEYAGERITPAEAERRYPEMPGVAYHTQLFAIDGPDGEEVIVDAAVDGNVARFINHSCDPNCDAIVDDGRIWITTVRDVAAGEELAYDYAFVLQERHTPAAKRRYPCYCGAATCRRTMLAKKR